MGAPHVALFPFPDHGHVTPMLQLALHLASRGAYVTFINAELGHQQLPSFTEYLNQTANLKYAHLSVGISALEGPLTLDVVVSDSSGLGNVESSSLPVLHRSLESQSSALEKLLTDLNGAQNWPSFSCLISDAFMPWTASVAQKLQVSWMVFWTPSATRFYLSTKALGHKEMNTELQKLANITIGLSPESTDVFDLSRLRNPHRRQLLMARVEGTKMADVILLNTFDALEEEAVKELAKDFPIRSLGPLCFGTGLKASKANEESLSWLDRQAPHSILYISFGSKAMLQGRPLEQLAFGIESSNMPFLWVLRSGGEGLPEGFVERTEARSKIMKWVPQKQVLEHRAIGAFFTHCGWNSVLEAVVEGVPMICWPTFGDQPTNKLVIEQKWRIGRGIQGGEVDAENIRQVIQDVVGNAEFRQRGSLLSRSAKSALGQGGTSDQNFKFLMQELAVREHHVASC
ncbi:hypothetical protein GOP47_0000581 [Adiantum capillus-veneris]|uniref:Glycosyltransferase n=1 Tax=Adiantum capillus-veneris TaxID=13818 RepID=A0A9D4ZT15_ADICA|nr:hypothetical protein GOP47_0000581 [Adiantum capillus-veneris]